MWNYLELPEESQGVSRSGWPVVMSVGHCFDDISWCGKIHPTVGFTIPCLGPGRHKNIENRLRCVRYAFIISLLLTMTLCDKLFQMPATLASLKWQIVRWNREIKETISLLHCFYWAILSQKQNLNWDNKHRGDFINKDAVELTNDF